MTFSSPRISIIIPVHNEGKIITVVLESVKSINYGNIELIIIDNSDDGMTSKLIEEWIKGGSYNKPIKYLKFEKGLGAPRARNIGIKLAKGDYIFLLDADVVLKEEALLQALKLLESDSNIGAISTLYLHENPSILERVYASRYIGKIKDGPLATGAAMIPMKIIEKVGYLNECLNYPNKVYDDWEYGVRINRAGFKTLINGKIILTHLPKARASKMPCTRNSILCPILYRLKEYMSSKTAEALLRVLVAGSLKLKLEYSLYALSSWTVTLFSLLTLIQSSVLFLYILLLFIMSYFTLWLLYYLYDFGLLRFKDALLFTCFSLVSRHIRAFALTLWLPIVYIRLKEECSDPNLL
jgi:glycosyltransferase involved in cell wall biosynthesis